MWAGFPALEVARQVAAGRLGLATLCYTISRRTWRYAGHTAKTNRCANVLLSQLPGSATKGISREREDPPRMA